jgi:hypothetical protein
VVVFALIVPIVGVLLLSTMLQLRLQGLVRDEGRVEDRDFHYGGVGVGIKIGRSCGAAGLGVVVGVVSAVDVLGHGSVGYDGRRGTRAEV